MGIVPDSWRSNGNIDSYEVDSLSRGLGYNTVALWYNNYVKQSYVANKPGVIYCAVLLNNKTGVLSAVARIHKTIGRKVNDSIDFTRTDMRRTFVYH